MGEEHKDERSASCSGPFPAHNSLAAGDLQAGWEARRAPGEPAAPSAADGAERQRRPGYRHPGGITGRAGHPQAPQCSGIGMCVHTS